MTTRKHRKKNYPEGISRKMLEGSHIISKLLEPFLKINHEAKIIEEKLLQNILDDQKRYLIERPWGDPSLNIILPSTDQEIDKLISALNSVELLRKFSGIYHIEENTVEFIFKSFTIGEEQHTRYTHRNFEYTYRGEKIKCKFAKASETLITIANSCEIGYFETQTDYRNILKIKQKHLIQPSDEVISFFVEMKSISTDKLPDLSRSINVDMSRFDRDTPVIVLHDPKLYRRQNKPKHNTQPFPKKIESSNLDEIVDYFWLSIVQAKDPASRLLNSFRVIEYYSSSYSDEEKKLKIISLHETLNSTGDFDSFIANVTKTVYSGSDKKDHVRRRKLIDDWVDKNTLYKFIREHEDVFSKLTILDGGLKLHPIINRKESQFEWSKTSSERIMKTLSDLRHAIAHGGDGEEGYSFRASKINISTVTPYADLSEIIAEKIIFDRKNNIPKS